MRGATPSVYPPIYCACGRKVGEADIQQGSIRITCPKCGTINSLIVKVVPLPVPPPLYVSEHEGESKPTRKKLPANTTT